MKKWMCVFLLLINFATPADVVMINGKSINQKTMYRYEIQSIFLLRLAYWNNGLPITPILLSFDDPLHMEFVTKILKVTPYNYNLTISNKIESGDSSHVIVVNSPNEALEMVKKISGGIAYINSTIYLKNEKSIQIINIVD